MTSSELKPSRAIIDIGSNTIRLVIYGGPPRAPMILLNEKATAKLGKGVAEDGNLSKKSQDLALRALARFARLVRLKGLTKVDVVATAAVRDAANGPEFLKAVGALGLQPRLLTGAEEAETSASGVIGAFPGARGIVADLGGGSLELVDIREGKCAQGITLPLGTLTMPGLRADSGRGFQRKIARLLDASDWQPNTGETLYLVGGSLRAFAKYAIRRSNWPLEDTHGFTLSAEDAERIAATLTSRSADSPPLIGISTSRAAAMPDVAHLLRALLRKAQPARVVFSSWGLREGLIYRSLGSAAQLQDPLIAGVAAFAERYRVLSGTGAMVAGWCVSAKTLDHLAPRENLRLAATILALAASRLEPNLRADHAVDWALRKRWIGLTGEDRVLIASCLLANAGRKSVPEAWLQLAPPDHIREAQGWGLAIRLCRRLSDCAVEVLGNSSLETHAGQLELKVSKAFADLVSDDVERDLKLLAAHLGLEAGWKIDDGRRERR